MKDEDILEELRKEFEQFKCDLLSEIKNAPICRENAYTSSTNVRRIMVKQRLTAIYMGLVGLAALGTLSTYKAATPLYYINLEVVASSLDNDDLYLYNFLESVSTSDSDVEELGFDYTEEEELESFVVQLGINYFDRVVTCKTDNDIIQSMNFNFMPYPDALEKISENIAPDVVDGNGIMSFSVVNEDEEKGNMIEDFINDSLAPDIERHYPEHHPFIQIPPLVSQKLAMIQEYHLSKGKKRAVVGILLETNIYDDNLDELVSKSLPELMQILYELQSQR